MKSAFKKTTFLNMVLLGLVALLLLAAIFCGHSQLAILHGNVASIEQNCIMHVLFAMPFSQWGDQILFSLLILVMTLLVYKNIRSVGMAQPVPLKMAHVPQDLFFETRNYLHQAFSRGIIHGQKYNLLTVAY